MTEYTELKRLAEALLASDDHADFPGWMAASDAFDNATGPAAILALIAENERLKTLRSTTERDLAQELEVWRHGPSCWNCGDTGDVHDMVGEWRGQCDCNAAKLIDVSSERDQLKAENEALCAKVANLNVSGFADAFYTVAEKLGITGARPVSPMQVFANEVLPALDVVIKNAARYQLLRLADWWRSPICVIRNPKEQAKLGSDCPTGERLDSAVDAAIGKGEQS